MDEDGDYDDCDFDDDAPEKTIADEDMHLELPTNSPNIPYNERNDKIIEDPQNISINYDDDSFSPTGFSPEKPLTDPAQNELPVEFNSSVIHPQAQDYRGGPNIEDPMNISANYDDDKDFSLSGLSEIFASSSVVIETDPQQVTTALNTDFSLISDPQNEEGSVKIKPISIPESSTGADLPNFFLARTHPFSEGCQISVQVYKIIASNLRNTEIVGQIDPYISLSLNNGYWSALTSVLTNAGPDMEWKIDDMRFIISIHQLKSSVLTVQAFDSNSFEKDRIIGSGEMTMADGAFTAVDGLKLTIPLKEKAGLDSGTLTVVLRLAVATEDRKTNASNVEALLLSDSRHSSEVAESLKQHEIVKDASSESPAKAGISLELSLPQLQIQIPTTDANSYTGPEKQNQGFPSNQFTSEKLKDMMEDATFRAILFADSENNYPWNGNVLKLMKTAASKSILSAQFDDNDSVDSKGCAKGFGYKSITAGLKIADLRMKIRASGSSSALRRSMGVDAVRRLSSFVNSPKSTAMLAATATAAVSALSPSRKQQSLQSEEELQNIINSVLADLRRSFNTMVLDYTDDNTSVGTAESHKSKAGRSRSSSWKLDQADSAIGSSADSELDPGNSSIMKIGKQKLQRCSSAPSKSFTNFAQSVSPRNAYTSENNILRLLHVSQGKNILQMMHRAPEKNIFKIIQSENFIESSIYQWAKPKKSGVNPPHLRKSIKAGKGKSTAKSNNVSELDDEHSGKKSTTKTPQQPKKQAPTKTQTAAVSLKMTSPIFYKKKRLMEAAQFAKSVVENSEEAQWDASGTLSPPPVARFRIIKLLGNTGDDRSDHDMKVSKATENDADNLKQAMAELEQITLRDIMRPLPDLRKNMTWTEIAATSAKKRAMASPGSAVSVFDVPEDVIIESKDSSTVAAAIPTLSFSKASLSYPQLLSRASTPSMSLPQSALGGSINGRSTQDGPTLRKRMPLLINVLSEKDLRKTRKVKL